MTLNLTNVQFTEGGADVEVVRLVGGSISVSEIEFGEHGVMVVDNTTPPAEVRFIPYTNISQIHAQQ